MNNTRKQEVQFMLETVAELVEKSREHDVESTRHFLRADGLIKQCGLGHGHYLLPGNKAILEIDEGYVGVHRVQTLDELFDE